MKKRRISDFVEGTSAQSDQVKENGEDPRQQTVLLLDGGGIRKPTATITLMALDESERAKVDAAIRSLLADFVREAISEGGTF